MKKIRILHVLSALDAGGVETMLYQYYTHLDTQRVQFDFIVYSEKIGRSEAAFSDMGSAVYHVTPKRESLFRNTRDIANVLRQGKYDAVHVHQGVSSLNTLMLARRYGVPVKIVHNHGVKTAGGLKGVFLRMLRVLCCRYADWYFACSDEAGENMFGRRWKTDPHCFLMKNAEELDRFVFDAAVRQNLRDAAGLDNGALLLLHAGRMDEAKNQRFLLDVLAAVQKKEPKARLVLAGDGPLKEMLMQKAAEKGLENSIRFLGVVQNLNEWYMAADAFVFPSKHEGLGMVAVEAQISGLPVLCSTGVPRSVALTRAVRFLPLEAGAPAFADAVLEMRAFPRSSGYAAVKAAGYDIQAASREYQDWIDHNIGV